MLLVALLARVTRETALAYADRVLFKPLGIHNRLWQPDPEGNYFGGSELYLSARDMAKFGYLYLNEGAWEGDQIVPVDWVRASTSRAVTLPDGEGYGYLWWLDSYSGHRVYMAKGLGGQRIHVIPDLDMVTVVTCDLSTPNANNAVDELARMAIEAVVQ
jgi:CubicO group peptidase (beta-lactamase class C family)